VVDPEAQGPHDALDQMKDRLLPLKQPVLDPLDPRTEHLCIDLAAVDATRYQQRQRQNAL
jgi:hypothetical protein